ncbi:hypothetical protein STRCI_001287 [Streptomyces cinnabarinus]|uniref:DNA-binding phage zinc finger domain-containing protein n=1 Tax=Streptomyces cinnabarinus TaxID=67287 RepID=A0ABY7K6P5_9ACTN|nr:hypothetical protein [Streptomyces cinnabarinus]WAZ20188.1 hypothetical protein STRCI_001287 [Streptomyces cinnabarinus]
MWDELAAALQALLQGLTDGLDSIAAITDAMRAHDERVERNRAADEVRMDRWREAQERKMAEEEVTRKVECPYCGASPGTSCRTAPPARAVRTGSHRDRCRLARGLNEGAAEPPDRAKQDDHALSVLNNAPDEELRRWAARELDVSALQAGQISQAEFQRRWPDDQGRDEC